MIARDGRPLIALGSAFTAAVVVAALLLDHWIVVMAAVVLGLLTCFLAYFFRDPERTSPETPGVVVSPADGWIVSISRVDSHPFVGASPTRLAIFLSVFDVHVNRSPAAGRVDYVDYRPGAFQAAFRSTAGDVNEQTEIGLTTSSGMRLAFRQIAGVLARRVVCRLQSGQQVKAGERCGIIKFGSRADVFLPPGSTINVRKGDHVAGGKTVLGHLPTVGSGQPETSTSRSQDA